MMAGRDVIVGPATPYKTESHTSHSGRVTATFKAEPIPIGAGLNLNPWYFKTVPGILKLVQVVLGMICLGCGTPALTGYARFFLFVSATCYILTVLLCIIIVLGVNTALTHIPWLMGELIYTCIASMAYLLAAILQISITASYDWTSMFISLRDQYIAAGFFGLMQADCLRCWSIFPLCGMEGNKTSSSPTQVVTN